jgi:phage/plasmid-like protein (TIGR03299 family)
MSHLVEKMAYVGETPWHHLGTQLPPQQPIEVWAERAGMNWRILEAPVQYRPYADGTESPLQTVDEQKVLYRSDTHAALSVVGGRYQVVQPREVLEFYRDLTEAGGYELETAGSLKGGRKLWALARTGQGATLKGRDTVHGYLLLATSCDGTLATIAMPTSVRVVCNNTLGVALRGSSLGVKVPHSTSFDPHTVKRQLGVAVSNWGEFMYRMKTLSQRKVTNREATTYLLDVLSQGDSQGPAISNEKAVKRVQALFEGHGKGATLESAQNTAWGLLNAVTEFVDHERRARSREYRLDSAWFGPGAALKQRALDEALQLVA